MTYLASSSTGIGRLFFGFYPSRRIMIRDSFGKFICRAGYVLVDVTDESVYVEFRKRPELFTGPFTSFEYENTYEGEDWDKFQPDQSEDLKYVHEHIVRRMTYMREALCIYSEKES